MADSAQKTTGQVGDAGGGAAPAAGPGTAAVPQVNVAPPVDLSGMSQTVSSPPAPQAEVPGAVGDQPTQAVDPVRPAVAAGADQSTPTTEGQPETVSQAGTPGPSLAEESPTSGESPTQTASSSANAGMAQLGAAAGECDDGVVGQATGVSQAKDADTPSAYPGGPVTDEKPAPEPAAGAVDLPTEQTPPAVVAAGANQVASVGGIPIEVVSDKPAETPKPGATQPASGAQPVVAETKPKFPWEVDEPEVAPPAVQPTAQPAAAVETPPAQAAVTPDPASSAATAKSPAEQTPPAAEAVVADRPGV